MNDSFLILFIILPCLNAIIIALIHLRYCQQHCHLQRAMLDEAFLLNELLMLIEAELASPSIPPPTQPLQSD